MGDKCGAHTFPYIEVRNPTASVEHEATTSKIGDDQLFYCLQRGISEEDAVNMIVNGFCKEVFKELPMEFAVEAQNLLAVSLEGSRWADRALHEMHEHAEDQEPARHASATSRSSTGIDLDGRRRRGARHHGPERLGQEHARAGARRPRGLRRHRTARSLIEGQDLLALRARRARARRRVPRLPVSGRDSRREQRLPAEGRRSTRCASTAASPKSTRSSSSRWCARR